MFRGSFVASFALAALFALVTQEASAWGSGGGIPTCCKEAPLFDFYCDLNEDVQGIPGLENDQFQILSTPSNASPDDEPTLIVGGTPENPGATRCVEVPHDTCGGPGQPECSLALAADDFPVGVFLWSQETDPAFSDGGLNYSEEPDPCPAAADEDCTRQWSVVAERGATLLFTVRLSLDLVNSDDVFWAYCEDFLKDEFGPPPVSPDDPYDRGDAFSSAIDQCVARIGFPEDTRNINELLRRFAAGEPINSDFGDGATWDRGEAIRFATQTANEEEVPIGFDIRTYNNTDFDSALPVVSFFEGDETQPTLSDADIVATVPLETQTQPNINVTNTSPTANLPFAVLGCIDLTFDEMGAPIDTSSAPHFCGANGPCFKVNGQVVRYDPIFTLDNTEQSDTFCDVPLDPPPGGGIALAVDLNLQVVRDDFINAITPCLQDGPATIRIRFPLVDENGDSSDRLGESEEIVNLTHCGSIEAPTTSGDGPTDNDLEAYDGEEIVDPPLDLGVSGMFIGTNLTYSATGLPCGLSIDPNTGVFSTIGCDSSPSSPGLGYAASQGGENGEYMIIVCAENRGGSDCASGTPIVLTVENVPPDDLPVIASPQFVKSGDEVNLPSCETNDGEPDGDDLTYSYTGDELPKGLTFNADTCEFSGTVARNPCGGGNIQSCDRIGEVGVDDGQTAPPAELPPKIEIIWKASKN